MPSKKTTSGAPELAMAMPRLFLRLLEGVAAESKLSLVCADDDALEDDCASKGSGAGAGFLLLGVTSSTASSGLTGGAPDSGESGPNRGWTRARLAPGAGSMVSDGAGDIGRFPRLSGHVPVVLWPSLESDDADCESQSMTRLGDEYMWSDGNEGKQKNNKKEKEIENEPELGYVDIATTRA